MAAENTHSNAPRRRSVWKSVFGFLAGITMLSAFCMLVFVTIGFTRFAISVRDHQNSAELPKAEAIVVLTGGKDRIQTATNLLKQQKAKRLLISGVNTGTSRKAVGRSAGIEKSLLDCCIDFDYRAKDTVGNAVHTSNWASQHGFKKVIVVTSDYHLPRGMLELRQTMPNVALEPYAVKFAPMQESKWFTNPDTLRVLMVEYGKYLAASLRIDFQRVDSKLTRFASANGF